MRNWNKEFVLRQRNSAFLIKNTCGSRWPFQRPCATRLAMRHNGRRNNCSQSSKVQCSTFCSRAWRKPRCPISRRTMTLLMILLQRRRNPVRKTWMFHPICSCQTHMCHVTVRLGATNNRKDHLEKRQSGDKDNLWQTVPLALRPPFWGLNPDLICAMDPFVRQNAEHAHRHSPQFWRLSSAHPKDNQQIVDTF